MDRYRTLSTDSEGLVREKASKFIAYAFPIADEAAFKERCAAIAKEHHAARHVCYAWALGDAGERTRANDDGEPAGTAGRPILQRLRSASLTYCAVVVVRYFGGTLLGKPGLVRAYGDAAQEAIAANTIVERILSTTLTVTCTYAQLGLVKRDIAAADGAVLRTGSGEVCSITASIARHAAEALARRWREAGMTVE